VADVIAVILEDEIITPNEEKQMESILEAVDAPQSVKLEIAESMHEVVKEIYDPLGLLGK